jgi:hypothetical protein
MIGPVGSMSSSSRSGSSTSSIISTIITRVEYKEWKNNYGGGYRRKLMSETAVSGHVPQLLPTQKLELYLYNINNLSADHLTKRLVTVSLEHCGNGIDTSYRRQGQWIFHEECPRIFCSATFWRPAPREPLRPGQPCSWLLACYRDSTLLSRVKAAEAQRP